MNSAVNYLLGVSSAGVCSISLAAFVETYDSSGGKDCCQLQVVEFVRIGMEGSFGIKGQPGYQSEAMFTQRGADSHLLSEVQSGIHFQKCLRSEFHSRLPVDSCVQIHRGIYYLVIYHLFIYLFI